MADKKRSGLNFNDDSVKDIFNFNNIYDKEPQKPQPIKKDFTEPQQPIKAETKTTSLNTTDKGLKSGFTRTTLEIDTNQLNKIKALSFLTQIKKVDILTQLLERGLTELKKEKPELIDEALTKYNNATASNKLF